MTALIHAFVSISLRADQIVSGTAINFLALGVTGYFFIDVYGDQGTPGEGIPRIPTVNLDFLSSIPGVGTFLEDVFGHLNLMVWLSFVLLIVSYFVIFKSPIGLRLRAVGEHPRAADTVGISVYTTRYVAVVISGILAALGGAYLSIGFLGSFNENMTAGRGFIALAALIFGNWRPFGAFGAALLFGFSSALAQRLPGVLDVRGDPLPGAPVRADPDRRGRRDRPLHPARSRRATVRQAVATDAERTCSLVGSARPARDPGDPRRRGLRRPEPARRADLGRCRGARGRAPRARGAGCRAGGQAPRAADPAPQRRADRRRGRFLGLFGLLFAGTGTISLIVYAILTWRGRT